ncbi:ATP-dependent serine protease [Parabacteroides sp. OttesenSCG-928-K15]|nr:ATP-dependent serine protease [Parabacteroides sp. OttesenSCG-928-K15]
MKKKRMSVYNILKKEYKTIPFSEEWIDAFGHPETTGIWYVSGKPTNGKTAFTMKLTYELARIGMRVAYFSYEEGTRYPFQDKIRRFNWRDVDRNIIIEDFEYRFISFKEMGKWLEANKRVKVVVIDSIQRWDMKRKDLSELMLMAQSRLFIFVSHVDGKGQPSGAVATEIHRDAYLKIWVEGFRAFSKGRIFGSKGYYDIWKEKADAYWAENI